MTIEQLEAEIANLKEQINQKHEEIATANGAIQAFLYVLKHDFQPTAVAEPGEPS